MRLEAIAGLRPQPRDARAVAALRAMLATETHPTLRREVHLSLTWQDPTYRAQVDAAARARGRAYYLDVRLADDSRSQSQSPTPSPTGR